MLTQDDLQHFTKKTDTVSIYYRGETLSGKDLGFHKDAEFEGLKSVPEEIIKNKLFMSDLVGEDMFLQYPDSSSWSTTYHIEYVQIKEIVENPEYDNSGNYLIIFKRLMVAPDSIPEWILLYNEPSEQFLSKNTWNQNIPSYKMWISPYKYNTLCEKLR